MFLLEIGQLSVLYLDVAGLHVAEERALSENLLSHTLDFLQDLPLEVLPYSDHQEHDRSRGKRDLDAIMACSACRSSHSNTRWRISLSTNSEKVLIESREMTVSMFAIRK